MYYYTRGMACMAGVILLIIYCVGLIQPSWYLVHRYDFTGNVIANMGLFTACGFNESLQVKALDVGYGKVCVSLLQSGFPGWVRAVQFFAILGLFLLCVLTLLWFFVITCGDLSSKRHWGPVYVLLVTLGIVLLVHPIIFAVHLRPRTEKLESTNPFLYDDITITWLYWGAFILHCIVAGFVNFISLMSSCCIYCCTR